MSKVEIIKRIKIVDADTGEDLIVEPESCESCPFVYRKREDYDKDLDENGEEFEDANDIIGCWLDPCNYGGDPTPLFVMSKEYNKDADWSNKRPEFGEDFVCPFMQMRREIEIHVLDVPDYIEHVCDPSRPYVKTILSRENSEHSTKCTKCGYSVVFKKKV